MKNKKLFFWVIALVFLLTSIPTNFTYGSTPSSWAISDIQEAQMNNLTTPKVLNNYQGNITREESTELAVKLYEALSNTVVTPLSPNPFNDTNNPEVLKAYELGIVSGVSSNQFAPHKYITRQEISVILFRTIQSAMPQLDFNVKDPKTFTDINLIAPWALDSVLFLSHHDILTGFDGHINPSSYVTKEQAIVLVNRSFKNFFNQSTTLKVGLPYVPYSLDPHVANDRSSTRTMVQIYETLLYTDEQGELVPGLAESWKQIDPLTYEFTLKEGVKFHNGEIMTAHDVAFSLNRAVESIYIYHLISNIDPNKIEVIDETTIRISTIVPNNSILFSLTHISTGILNEKAVLEAGENYHLTPIGTGPYQFYASTSDEVELHVFHDYHDTTPKTDKIIMKTIFDDKARYEALIDGNIHIAYDLDPSLNTVSLDKDLLLYQDVTLNTNYVGMNCKKTPLKDIRVRQAINYAIDNDALIEDVYSNSLTSPKGIISPAVWGAHPDLQDYSYDLVKAQRLMREAGYPNGFNLTIAVNDTVERIAAAENLQVQLQAININLEIVVLEWAHFLDATAQGEYDMFVLGWTTVLGEADYGLYPLFHSSAIGTAGNRTFYSNKEVDNLLDLARETEDPKLRKDYYHRAQEIIQEETPWITLGHSLNTTVTTSNVVGFKNHPSGNNKLHEVYLIN